MVGGSSIWVLVVLSFLAMNGANAIFCQETVARMLPCQGFLMGIGQITDPCCQSAQSLIEIAKTTPEERTSVCQCLKQAVVMMGINVTKAQEIPQLCHMDLDAGLIDPNVDCNKLNEAPTPRSSSVERKLESVGSRPYKLDHIQIPITSRAQT
ncbi:non-specific lipid-transfer protein 1-like, partial [Cynara cardunculus var. scolymus]|uniref:non-specific lipid-transfer protein 1-like n=1 Tax=Cynara cardunculus var. scolymus TaxID=59895 RepID=UPI000D6264C6